MILPGWYNRRGFINILETEIHRSRRYQEHLALCLMGIDLEVSDNRMSFEIKDRNFRLIGQTLSTLIRKSDYLGRLDAETFALLMPQTSAQKAEPVCNRLRNLLLKKNWIPTVSAWMSFSVLWDSIISPKRQPCKCSNGPENISWTKESLKIQPGRGSICRQE